MEANFKFTYYIFLYICRVIDSYRHKGLRNQLVKELQRKGVNNPTILAAIGKIPRHQFLEKAFDEWAYKDNAFPIDCEQTISQPFTVAFQTDLLQIKPKELVLEIGLGSGYQASVLYEMGAKVYSSAIIARQPSVPNLISVIFLIPMRKDK